MHQDDQFDVRQYILLLRKRARLLIVVVVLCVMVGAGYSFMQPKIYSASARVVLSNQQDALTSVGTLSDPNGFQNQVGTQVQVVKSAAVKEAANDVLGADKSSVIAVSAGGVASTRIMQISVTSEKPAVARNAANAYANAYLQNRDDSEVNNLLSVGTAVQHKQQELQDQINDLTTKANVTPAPVNVSSLNAQIASLNAQIKQLQTQYDTVQANATVRQSGASLLSVADVPTTPISPKPMRTILLALILGLLIGIGGALLLERFDDGIKTEQDLQRYLPGVPYLVGIPSVNGWKNITEARAVTLLEPQSQAAEAYRRLRTSIEFLGLDKELKVIEITSASAGEGKSTTVANLAMALAWTGKKVVIVGADLRRPRVHEFFGLKNDRGLTSVLLSGDDLTQVLQATPVNGPGSVHVLATGPLPPNPAELLSSPRVRDLIATLRSCADYVLIDSPPLLPVADPLVLTAYSDGVVMVVGANKLHARELVRSNDILARSSNAPFLGVVLNGIVDHAGYARKDAYYYAANPVPALAAVK